MADDLELSVIFTGIDRPRCVENAVCSVRKHLPGARIYYGAQGIEDVDLREFCAHYGVAFVELPEDCGLADARNQLLDRVETRYFLLLDDDHIIHRPTEIALGVEFLREQPDACIVGGDFINYVYDEAGRLKGTNTKSYSYVLTQDEDLGAVYCTPLRFTSRRPLKFRDRDFLKVDMTHNFFVCDKQRLDEIGLRWDPRMKIGGEHLDFFLRFKRASKGYSVYYQPKMTVQHHRFISADYLQMRRRPIGADVLDEKWAMRAGIVYVDWGIRYPKTVGVSPNRTLAKSLFEVTSG